MWSFCAVLGILVSTLLPQNLLASPITFTETVVGSGSLGGTSFRGQTVALTGTADTNDVLALTGTLTGIYLVQLINPTVQIGSGPAALFTGDIVAYTNTTYQRGGFSELFGYDILDAGPVVAFGTYRLDHSIAETGNTIFNPGLTFDTTSGLFDLTHTNARTTFIATVIPAAMPEPSSFELLLIGMLGAAGAARRRLYLSPT